MELKKISLSAKLAGKALIGFDTSSWGGDCAPETRNAKIGTKSGAKVGTKLGSKIVEIKARIGLKN